MVDLERRQWGRLENIRRELDRLKQEHDACFAWREDDSANVIEFERPERESYPEGENPLDQVLEYVERFKTSGSLRDAKGRVINPNIKNASFQCYIIADLTDGLTKRLRGHGEPTLDGEGLFRMRNCCETPNFAIQYFSKN